MRYCLFCDETTMLTYEEFEQELQKALSHLYDHHYQPSTALCTMIGCDSQDGVPTIRTAILHAVENLSPAPDTPPAAHTKLLYDLLNYRFVLKLTQEDTAYRLNVSRRTINRMQHAAVRALAGALWEQNQEAERAPGEPPRREGDRPTLEEALDIQAPDWRSQVQRELDSLQTKAPDALSDVEQTIHDALKLVDALASELGVHVDVRSVQPDLVAAVHPVLLQQVLISTIKRLASHVSDGQITTYARLEDGNATITLTGTIASVGALNEADLIRDIPTSEDISIEAHLDGAQVFVWIKSPSADRVTVLVVDDNEDMARFYRDCTLGTRYYIAHITRGRELSEAIQATAPDIIVLDVMLPDIDGWRLLMRLREDPTTRPIPVIICSVVHEEDLALSLGAASYLSKPVRPREFIQTLDQVLLQAPTSAWKSPANNAQAC
jgi:twitching motility two-component system response regulator PilH